MIDQQTFDEARRLMVATQLRPNAVTDTAVLASMARIPRERFVPAAAQANAYIDRPLPTGVPGRAINPPLATARLINALRPRHGERALVVGAATGYGAAILADIGLAVTAVEADETLAAEARRALAHTVTAVDVGALAEGHAGGGPYDIILVDGAIERVPPALVEQLVDGGRLACAIIERGVSRLAVGRKSGTAFGLSAFADSEAVPLPGFAEPPAFTF